MQGFGFYWSVARAPGGASERPVTEAPKKALRGWTRNQAAVTLRSRVSWPRSVDASTHHRSHRSSAVVMASTLVDGGVPYSRHNQKLAKRTAAWKPGILPFLLPFVLLVAFGLWTYQPSSSPLSWILTIVWSLPVVGVMVGIQ